MLDLQSQDSRLAQLMHRKKTLPEHDQIAELEAQAAELDGQRIEADTRVSDLTREQKKSDLEVEQVRTRRTRDEERMNSGQISNPRDLDSMQREVVALDRRIGALEDEELEVMERLEEAQQRQAKISAELAEIETARDQAAGTRDAKITEIDNDITEATTEREIYAQKIPEDLMELYDKLRAQYAGLGAAALRAKTCQGCRLEINGGDLRELVEQPSDAVLRCPECSRILVRTPESGV